MTVDNILSICFSHFLSLLLEYNRHLWTVVKPSPEKTENHPYFFSRNLQHNNKKPSY